MPSSSRPTKHCDLVEQTDLSAVFDAIEIEHLPFKDDRTYVIYGQAVLKLIVTDGELSEARAFDIECWDAPSDGPIPVMAAFIDEVKNSDWS